MNDNGSKNWKKPKFNEFNLTKWNWMCQHHEKLILSKNVDIGAYSYLNAKFGIEIGENTEIGSHCSVYSISTIDNKKGKVIIGKNVKIGTHSTVMPGINIGDGALIGAYSFVNKDIPPHSFSFGIPVKIIRKEGSD